MTGSRFFRVERFIALLTILSFTLTQAAPAFALRPEIDKVGLEEAVKKAGVKEATVTTTGSAEPGIRNANLPPHHLQKDSPLEDVVDLLSHDTLWEQRRSLRDIPGWSFKSILDLFVSYQDILSDRRSEWPLIIGRLLDPAATRAHRGLEKLSSSLWYCSACATYASAHQLTPVHQARVGDNLEFFRHLIASFLIARQAVVMGSVHISETGEPIYSLRDLREIISTSQPVHSIQFDGENPIHQILVTLGEIGGEALVFVRRRLPDGSTMLHTVNLMLDPAARPTTVTLADGSTQRVSVSVMDNDELRSLSEFMTDNTFTGTAAFIQNVRRQEVEGAAGMTGAYHWMTREEEQAVEGCCGIIGYFGTWNPQEGAYQGGHALGYRGPEGFGIERDGLGGFIVVRTPGEVSGTIQNLTVGPFYPDRYPPDGDKKREILAQSDGVAGLVDDLSGQHAKGFFSSDGPIAVRAGSRGAARAAASYPMTMGGVLGSEDSQRRPTDFVGDIQRIHGLSRQTILWTLWKRFQVFLKNTLPPVDDDALAIIAAQEEVRKKIQAIVIWAAELTETQTVSSNAPVPSFTVQPAVPAKSKPRPQEAESAMTLNELRRHFPGVIFEEDVDPMKISLEAKLEKGAKISGAYTWIQAHAVVGSGSTIRNSILHQGSWVGSDVRLTDTTLREKSVVLGSETPRKDMRGVQFVETQLVSSWIGEGTEIGASSIIEKTRLPARISILEGSAISSALVLDPTSDRLTEGPVRIQLDTSMNGRVIRAGGSDEEQRQLRGVVLKANVDRRKIATSVIFSGSATLEGEETVVGEEVRIGEGAHLLSSALDQGVEIGDQTHIRFSEIGAFSKISLGPPIQVEGQEKHILLNAKIGAHVRVINSTVKNCELEDGVVVDEDSNLVTSDAPRFGMRDHEGNTVRISVGPAVPGKSRAIAPFLPTVFAPYVDDDEGQPVALSLERMRRLTLHTQGNSDMQNRWEGHATQYEGVMEDRVKVQVKVRKEALPMGKVGAGGVIRNADVQDSLIGSSAILDGSQGRVFVHRCTIDSEQDRVTRIESGSKVIETFVQSGAHFRDGADVKQSFVYEWANIGYGAQVFQSIIGPLCEIRHVQVEHSFLGPFSIANHPGGIVLGVINPYGKVNYSHGVSAGSNHDAYKARWEMWLAEMVFLGLVTDFKYPIMTQEAPVGLVGLGASMSEEMLAHPFWMVTKGTQDRNEIRPGALLWRAFIAVTMRNNIKYTHRSASAGELREVPQAELEIFRPEVMAAVEKSRDELSKAPRDIRESLGAVQEALLRRDSVAAFRLLLPVLANRTRVKAVAVLETVSETAQGAQRILKRLNEAIEAGDPRAVAEAVHELLSSQEFEKVIARGGWEALKEFRALLYQGVREWNDALSHFDPKKDDLKTSLKTFVWKRWYLGSPTSDLRFGYFDYFGLGNNTMSELSRQSAIAHYDRYLQWYCLGVLLRRSRAIEDSGKVSGWGEIRAHLARSFFEGQQELVNRYVEEKRQWRFEEAAKLKKELRGRFRELPPERRIGIPEGTSQEDALDMAIEWDWVLGRFGRELSRPLGSGFVDPALSKTKAVWEEGIRGSLGGASSGDFAGAVNHDVAHWTLEEYQQHLGLLGSLTQLLEEEVRYGALERGVQEAQAIIPDYRDVHVRSGTSEVMQNLLNDTIVLFNDANGLSPEYSVRQMTPEAREAKRREIWHLLSQVPDSQGNKGHLEIPPDFDPDAVRYAFRALEEGTLTQIGAARHYGIDYGVRLEEIHRRRRSSSSQAGLEEATSWRQGWDQEAMLNQAGHSFASAVEFLYRWASDMGLLPPDIFARLEANDYGWAYQQGYIGKDLLDAYASGKTNLDLLGTFTTLTAHLARLFRLAHARWAVYGMPFGPNTHPFVSANEIWIGAQNGVLDGSLFEMKQIEQQQEGLRHRSTNDAEVIVNEVQAVFDRRRRGAIGKLSPREQLHWDLIAQEMARVKREEIAAQWAHADSQEIDAFMERYTKSLPFENEVAVWAAMSNLATGASSFAMAIRSRLNPLAAYFVSFNRPLLILWRPETGDVVGTSDANAALGLWPPELQDRAATELMGIQDASRAAQAGQWNEMLEGVIHNATSVDGETRRDLIEALKELAERRTQLQTLVPGYHIGLLRELEGQVKIAEGGQSEQLQSQIQAIQRYQEAQTRVIDEETGIRQRAFNQILEPFGYHAIELQSVPAEDPTSSEITGGMINFVKVEPTFNREKGNFDLKVTTYQGNVKALGASTELEWIRQVTPVAEEEAAEDESRPILTTKGKLNPAQAGKGKYGTFAEKHLSEIPLTYREKLDEYFRRGRLKGWNLESLRQRFGGPTLPNLKRIFLFGEGSSYYVGLTVKAFIEEQLPGIKVIVMRPPDALYLMGEKEQGEDILKVRPEEDLCFIMSWSGETASLVTLTEQLRKRQREKGGILSAMMHWFGGKATSLLARIGRRSAGATQTDRSEDGPEITIFTTRGKADMDLGITLGALDLAKMREPTKDFTSAEEDLFQLSIAVAQLLDDQASPETAREWESELRETGRRFADCNKVAVIGNTPTRHEADLKMEEGINIFGTQFLLDNEGFWTAVLPESQRNERGALIMPIHNRTVPHIIATRGSPSNLRTARIELDRLQKLGRLGISFSCLVAEDHPYLDQIIALRESVPSRIRQQYPQVSDADVPIVRIHVIPRVRPSLQAIADQMFFFQLTPYQASEHGLSSEQIDKSRWLAKSVTIAGLAALKAMMKAIRGVIVRVNRFLQSFGDRFSDSFRGYQQEAQLIAQQQIAGSLADSVAKDYAALTNLPDRYAELVHAVSSEDGLRGVNTASLRDHFGDKLNQLKEIFFIADSANYPAALAAEIPAAVLLGVETSVAEANEPLPLFGQRSRSTLAVVLAADDRDGLIREKIEGLRAQGVAVLSITGDTEVASLAGSKSLEDKLGIGSLERAQPTLAALQSEPTLSGAADLAVKTFLTHLGQLRGGETARESEEWIKAMARIPVATARVIEDKSRRETARKMSRTFAGRTTKDRRTGQIDYQKYDKIFCIGSRQSYPAAALLRQSLLARGIMADVQPGDSAKHGPLAAAPDVLIIIFATDKRTMTTALSDAQTYSARGADVILVVQEGDQTYPGISSAGVKRVITVPAAPDTMSLPIDAAVAELIANAYSEALGRNRLWIENQMDVLGLREGTSVPPLVPPLSLNASSVPTDAADPIMDTVNRFARSAAAALHQSGACGSVPQEDASLLMDTAESFNKADWQDNFFRRATEAGQGTVVFTADPRRSVIDHPQVGRIWFRIDSLRAILSGNFWQRELQRNQSGGVVVGLAGPGLTSLHWEKIPEGHMAMGIFTHIPEAQQEKYMHGKYALDPLMPVDKLQETLGELLKDNGFITDEGEPDWSRLEIVQSNDGAGKERLYRKKFSELLSLGADLILPLHGTSIWSLEALRPPKARENGKLRYVMTSMFLDVGLQNLAMTRAVGAGAWGSLTPLPPNIRDGEMVALASSESPIGGARSGYTPETRAAIDDWISKERADALLAGPEDPNHTFLTRRDVGEGGIYAAVVPVTATAAFGMHVVQGVKGLPATVRTDDPEAEHYRSFPVLVHDGYMYAASSDLRSGSLPADLKFSPAASRQTGLEEPSVSATVVATLTATEVSPSPRAITTVEEFLRALQEEGVTSAVKDSTTLQVQGKLAVLADPTLILGLAGLCGWKGEVPVVLVAQDELQEGRIRDRLAELGIEAAVVDASVWRQRLGLSDLSENSMEKILGAVRASYETPQLKAEVIYTLEGLIHFFDLPFVYEEFKAMREIVKQLMDKSTGLFA